MTLVVIRVSSCHSTSTFHPRPKPRPSLFRQLRSGLIEDNGPLGPGGSRGHKEMVPKPKRPVSRALLEQPEQDLRQLLEKLLPLVPKSLKVRPVPV